MPLPFRTQAGGVGVIPTDTLPAIVCDLHNRDAVLRLYSVKEMDARKPLSILCPSLSTITTYTTGFPTTASANWFNVARRLLPGPVSEREEWNQAGPGEAGRRGAVWHGYITVEGFGACAEGRVQPCRCGFEGWGRESGREVRGQVGRERGQLCVRRPLHVPTSATSLAHVPPSCGLPSQSPGPPQYTFVLPATKNLPPQCIDFMSGKNIHRKSVGVRMPADAVCQVRRQGCGGREARVVGPGRLLSRLRWVWDRREKLGAAEALGTVVTSRARGAGPLTSPDRRWRCVRGTNTFLASAPICPSRVRAFAHAFARARRLCPCGPQALLDGVGGALLCTSVHVPEVLSPDTEVPDCGSILEAYGSKGIDFVVRGWRAGWMWGWGGR